MNNFLLTNKIKAKAQELGFLSCGIAKADFLEAEAKFLTDWLNQKKHGKMHYMENNFEKRLDPRLLVPGAKSVISLSYNYFSNQKQPDESAPKIAMYAYGEDYHDLLRKKLNELFEYIKTEAGNIEGRSFVDSAPVLEKAWAQKSGLGWVGKNTNLLSKRIGSYFFLAEIILDLELDYDTPVKDYCGNCTKCIDACPTEALTPYAIDASKCISYLTIELKDEILPSKFKGKMDNWMYGCDVCQQVCPINSQAEPHHETAFEPLPELMNMTRADWENINEETFKKLFGKSAVKRTKFSGLKRNIQFLKK
jgi:epoxyqueuosine reductase